MPDADGLDGANEFDPETQRRLAERIQQQNVEENFASAMEHSPEVFSEVIMLYVEMQVRFPLATISLLRYFELAICLGSPIRGSNAISMTPLSSCLVDNAWALDGRAQACTVSCNNCFAS